LRAFGEVNDTTAEIAINGKAYYLIPNRLGCSCSLILWRIFVGGERCQNYKWNLI